MDGFDLDGTQRLVKDNTGMVCNNATIFMNRTWDIHHIRILLAYGLHVWKEMHTWQKEKYNWQRQGFDWMTLYCMANKLRMATVLYWGYHWGHLEETGRLPTGTSPTIPEGLAKFKSRGIKILRYTKGKRTGLFQSSGHLWLDYAAFYQFSLANVMISEVTTHG